MTRLRYRLELLYPFDRLRAGSVEALGLVSLTALGSLALYRSIPFYAAAAVADLTLSFILTLSAATLIYTAVYTWRFAR